MIKLRKASSMIELVIAIVVMGIAVMTLPLILERVQSNNQFAMQQEAILAAQTKLGDIVTYPWDDNTLQNNIVAVLDTNGSADYNRTVGAIRRVGHVVQDKRRKFFDITTTASANMGNAEGGDIDDIDDFNGDSQQIDSDNVVLGEETDLDYRFTVDLNTTVGYVSDAAFAFPIAIQTQTSNLKMVEIEASGNEMSTFQLRAYSSNIGESLLLRRDY